MARAQAWTPPAGAGSVLVSGQTLHVDGHLDGTGKLDHNIDLRAYSLTAAVDYGLTDRVALGLSVPYVSSRYRGRGAHAGSIVDDGRFHGAISDLALNVRWKAVDGPFVVTPSLGGQWPTRSYPTTGHASPGRGLTEYSAGVDVGHQASRISPSLFLRFGYSYSVVERVHDDISVDRSNADVGISYYVTPRVAVHVGNTWQHTHGGLDLPLKPDELAVHSHHHDQMLRANYWRGNAGISYTVRPRTDFFVAWATGIRARNGHAFRTVMVGTTWNFETPPLLRQLPD